MLTMTAKAAALMSPGKGVLVLDDYARAAVDALARPAMSFPQFIELVMHSTSLSPYLSGLVVPPDALPATGTRPPEITLGVRMPIPAGSFTLAEQDVGVAEWRANLSPGQVERGSTHTDAGALADGAAASIAASITPILTIAMPDLGTHSRGVTHAATANALTALSAALSRSGVDPAVVLMRVNMVVPGTDHPQQPTPEETAASTLTVLAESVPSDLGGVMLLSGGQSLDRACENLRAISSLARERSSQWPITFGFTRALVNAALDGSDPHDDLVRACARASQSASGVAAAL